MKILYNIIVVLRAGVAQLVEQLIRNQQVAGSSPATSSKKTPQSDEFSFCGVFIFYVLPGWAARLYVNQYGGVQRNLHGRRTIYSVSVGFGSVGGVLLFATGIKRFANLFLPRLHT